MALAGFVASLQSLPRRKRKTTEKRRISSVRKTYRRRSGHLPLQMLKELRENNPEDYKASLRMDRHSFNSLLALVRSKITKTDTIMRKCITAQERLAATLRFLATGRSFEDLRNSTGISAPALSILIPETCKAIYEVLRKDYMKVSESHNLLLFNFCPGT